MLGLNSLLRIPFSNADCTKDLDGEDPERSKPGMNSRQVDRYLT